MVGSMFSRVGSTWRSFSNAEVDLVMLRANVEVSEPASLTTTTTIPNSQTLDRLILLDLLTLPQRQPSPHARLRVQPPQLGMQRLTLLLLLLEFLSLDAIHGRIIGALDPILKLLLGLLVVGERRLLVGDVGLRNGLGLDGARELVDAGGTGALQKEGTKVSVPVNCDPLVSLAICSLMLL